MAKVIIIGGGASGLVSAIYAARGGNEVTVLERNENCGKKILVTGNGRCNYWNEDQTISHYYSNDLEILNKINTKENQAEVLRFFDTLGIVPKVKNGYYYPYSNQASSIKSALLLEAKLVGVKIINNALVNKIEKNEKFEVYYNDEKIIADKVILAAGAKAMPKTGSDGNGFDLVKMLGHSVIKPLPALVQLRGEEKHFKAWNGIRCEAEVTLVEDGEKVKTEQGELQLTDYGISGICVFNLSGIVARGLDAHKKEKVIINFLPFVKTGNFMDWIDNRHKKVKSRKIGELFEGVLNSKLVAVLISISNINPDCSWEELSLDQKSSLVSNLFSFSLNITGTNSFDKAQVCSGGVPLKEINYETMESLKVKGLYLTGELLDVYGDCGGYNLGFAWTSGMLAGRGIK